jgi:hypothetical protein
MVSQLPKALTCQILPPFLNIRRLGNVPTRWKLNKRTSLPPTQTSPPRSRRGHLLRVDQLPWSPPPSQLSWSLPFPASSPDHLRPRSPALLRPRSSALLRPRSSSLLGSRLPDPLCPRSPALVSPRSPNPLIVQSKRSPILSRALDRPGPNREGWRGEQLRWGWGRAGEDPHGSRDGRRQCWGPSR